MRQHAGVQGTMRIKAALLRRLEPVYIRMDGNIDLAEVMNKINKPRNCATAKDGDTKRGRDSAVTMSQAGTPHGHPQLHLLTRPRAAGLSK